MITNIFHTNPDTLGIQIERSRTGNSFEMHIALLIEGDKWVCKKLTISGDSEDTTLIDNAINKGIVLSEQEANQYFVHPHCKYTYLKEN